MRNDVTAVLAAWFAAVLLLLAGPTGGAAAMSYSTVPESADCRADCAHIMVATGEIAVDEDDRFSFFAETALSRGRVLKLLLIHSPGGSVVGAMKLGLVLREHGISVMVAQARERAGASQFGAGICTSACALVLAGGQKRIVPAASSVGVHASAAYRSSLLAGRSRLTPSAEREAGVDDMMAQYYRSMGVDAAIVRLSRAQSHEGIRILTQPELRRLRLATVSQPAAGPQRRADRR